MSEMPVTIKRSRYHGWLPRYREVHRAFIKQKVSKAIARKEHASRSKSEVLHTDAVARFAAAILGDSVMHNLFENIFLQVNTDPQVWPNQRLQYGNQPCSLVG